MKEENNINRKEEIVTACEELYQIHSFKEITMALISQKTSFSRPSIYNYFETKEEIFLELFKNEYDKWILELENILKNDSLSKEEFSKLIAKSLENRITLLKLLAMNVYDMEDNSRMEKLIEFKKSYGMAISTINKCLDKFFTYLTESEKQDFVFTFLPFMYGVYPYTCVTEKQENAMQEANVPYKYMSTYEMVYKGILNLLK